MGNCHSPSSAFSPPSSPTPPSPTKQDEQARARELEFIMARDTSRSISPTHNQPPNHNREEHVDEKNRWYVLDRIWLNSWLNYCTTGENGPRPGPVDNSPLLVVQDSTDSDSEEDKKDDCSPKFKKRTLRIKEDLVMDKEEETGHYRVVKAGVWEAFMSLYGGGPEIWVEGEMFEVEDLTKWHFEQKGVGEEQKEERDSIRHAESVVTNLEDLQINRLESIGIRDTQFELLKERTRQASVDSMESSRHSVRTEPMEILKPKGILGTVLQAENNNTRDTNSTETLSSENINLHELIQDKDVDHISLPSQTKSLPPPGPSTPPRHNGPSTYYHNGAQQKNISQPNNISAPINMTRFRTRSTSNESTSSIGTPSSMMFSKLADMGKSTATIGASLGSSLGSATATITRNVRQLSVDTQDEGEEEFIKKRREEMAKGGGAFKRESVAWLFDSDDE